MEEILNGLSFSKKFRIGYHIKGILTGLLNNLFLNPSIGANRDGALGYNNFITVQISRDSLNHCLNLRKVGLAILLWRGSDPDEFVPKTPYSFFNTNYVRNFPGYLVKRSPNNYLLIVNVLLK